MGNGRNAFAKQNPSAAFWCEAYKIMTVNARLPLAPKVVLLDEDFFVMEAAGKTLQGVAKEAEYAAVRHDAFEKAGQGLAQLHAAGLHHGRPALRDIAYDKETGTITFLDWEMKEIRRRAGARPRPVSLPAQLLPRGMAGQRPHRRGRRRLWPRRRQQPDHGRP